MQANTSPIQCTPLILLAAVYLHLLDDIVLLLLLLALVPGDGPPDLLVVAVVTHEGAAAGHLAGLAGKEEEGERDVDCEVYVKKKSGLDLLLFPREQCSKHGFLFRAKPVGVDQTYFILFYFKI